MPRYHLITGLPNAGKTTRLKTLLAADPAVHKHEIPCTAALSEWLPKTPEWNQFLKQRQGEEKPTKPPSVRIQLLLFAQYVTAQPVHLYIDNAHLVSGQKQELLKELLLATPLAVVTTLESNQLPVALRNILVTDQTQTESLVNRHLQPAFDFTEILVGLAFIASFFVEAHFSTALLIGVTYLLTSRRFRAAKQR